MKEPKARGDVLLRPMGKEWVLYDPKTRQVHILNVSAALTWSALDGTTPVEAIADEVASEMREAPAVEVVLADVRAAVARFREEGLLG